MATFIVDGVEKHATLHLNDVGIDYARDFIGSYEHGMTQDDDGRFVTNQETFDWWVQVLADQAAIETLLADYAARYGDDAVYQCLQEQGAYNTDLDAMLAAVKLALATLDD